MPPLPPLAQPGEIASILEHTRGGQTVVRRCQGRVCGVEVALVLIVVAWFSALFFERLFERLGGQ